MNRHNVASGSPWEPIVAYSRVVRVGNQVWVAGTTATDEAGTVMGAGDPYAQATYALRKIDKALREAGATMQDVVRTRTYLTNIDDWEAVGRAHAEVFRDVRPAATMVEVRRLITPEALVEIETDAVVP